MARGIQEHDVWQAADVLLLEGLRPTIERVRQKIGRGSPNTVSPMLETWFKHLGARIKDPGAFAAPAAAPDPVQLAAQHLWEVAQAEARREVDERVRDGLAAATASVEAEKERAALCEASAVASAAQVAHLQTDVESLRAALDAERRAHQSAQAQAAAAQQRAVDLQHDLAGARAGVAAERARADSSIAAADERSAGAERRAAMEIERERSLRAKEAKAAGVLAKRLEQALKEQTAAAEQLRAAEERHSRLESHAQARERQLQESMKALQGRIRDLEEALAQAQGNLSSAPLPEALVQQIVAQLAPVIEQRGQRAGSRGSPGKRKPTT
ncbi:DNA-binding protein [Rubrivivax gelatinosus]|uniref:DNA-binding protein n=1 Tax=Rubrivivax gelatinosus TaxID=28068 RepID=UPI0006811BF1|nr:DNA-binding protein [Rubrivivax gelatinosus]MBG6082439.1 chromosome segregation ATPase [Rubrivivax gelatinosus]